MVFNFQQKCQSNLMGGKIFTTNGAKITGYL